MPSTTRLAAASIAALLAATPLAAQLQEPVTAEVMTQDGQSAGTVTFEQAEHGVIITAELENLPEGGHGFHIHETGECQPDFQAARGHYSPLGNEHGFDTPAGYHVGDLPNVYVAADGTATADFFAPHLTLDAFAGTTGEAPFTLFDDDGSAIMIHRDIDDYRAETANSTGPRIACGVIVPPGD